MQESVMAHSVPNPTLSYQTASKSAANPDRAAAADDDTVSRLLDAGNLSPEQLTEVETPIPARKQKKLGKERVTSAQLDTSREDDLDELSPEQTAKRAEMPGVSLPMLKNNAHLGVVSDSPEAEIVEEIDDHRAAIVLGQSRSKRNHANFTASTGARTSGTFELPTSKRQRRLQGARNVEKEKELSKSTPNKNPQPIKKRSGKPKLRSGSPIPVTVHRLTRAPVYDDGESDASILNKQIPHQKRIGVNTIDVLRQICQEIFGSALDTLQQGRESVEDPSLKREYLTKWRAVKSFTDEVYGRLIEHVSNQARPFTKRRSNYFRVDCQPGPFLSFDTPIEVREEKAA